jgi:hypothetical protein
MRGNCMQKNFMPGNGMLENVILPNGTEGKNHAG